MMDGLTDSLAAVSIGAAAAVAVGAAAIVSNSTSTKPHSSLDDMLRLGDRIKISIAGDGNCAYHACCACLDETHLKSLGLWAVTQAGRSQSDMKLQREVRKRVVDFLQKDENKEHRYVGVSSDELEWDAASNRWKPIPPPGASAMEIHRSDGTYAETPQLRALAEVLACCIVSLDSKALYDRIPVFTKGKRQTLQLKSWRVIAPTLREPGGTFAAGMPTIVVVNNGLTGPGSHFDATLLRS